MTHLRVTKAEIMLRFTKEFDGFLALTDGIFGETGVTAEIRLRDGIYREDEGGLVELLVVLLQMVLRARNDDVSCRSKT